MRAEADKRIPEKPDLKPHQIPPADYREWHIDGFRRASGKTFAGAYEMSRLIKAGGHFALVAANRQHIEVVMMPELTRWLGESTRRYGDAVTWGQSVAHLVASGNPDRLRSISLNAAWWDEPHLEQDKRAIYEMDCELMRVVRDEPAKVIISGAYWVPKMPRRGREAGVRRIADLPGLTERFV